MEPSRPVLAVVVLVAALAKELQELHPAHHRHAPVADDDVDLPGREVEGELLALPGRHRPGEERHPDLVVTGEQRGEGHLVAEELLDRREVLGGEHLGGGEHRRLRPGVDGHEHRPQRDDGLAGADVAVEEPVHRRGLREVPGYLLADPDLGGGERERQVGVEAAAALPDLEQRGRGLSQHADRDDRDGQDGDQDVDDAGDAQADEHDPREVLLRVLGLLDHVDGVLESHEGEEGQGGHGGQRQEDRLVALGLEDHGPGEVGVALGRGPEADEDHDGQAGELDAGQHHVEHQGFLDAAQVDDHEQDHEADGHEGHRRHGRILPAEARHEVGGHGASGGGGGGQAGGKHGEGDHEGQQDAESEVDRKSEPHAARGAGPLAAVSKGPQQEGQQHDNRQGYGSRKSDGAVGGGAEEGVGKLGFIHAGRCGLRHLLGLRHEYVVVEQREHHVEHLVHGLAA